MKIERKGIRGPIVALASMVSSNDPSCDIIMWSIGGIFYWFRPNSTEQSLIILDYANLHGIVPQQGSDRVLLYGDKGICILNYNSDSNVFLVEVKHQNLDDMVLDCQILETSSSTYLLAVGYAHNFYDLMEFSKTGNSYKILKRYQCSEKFVLFSLSFSVYSKNDIIVASGNVFGKITLWKGIETAEESRLGNSRILGTIHQHEGVIFRLVWNSSRTKLITVSDDRTARVWRISHCENSEDLQINSIMVCWGHICRLWDAIFLNEEENLIATCSEDSTIKIWNEQSETISTFKGHLGSVWRVIKMQSQDWLVSAGNESALKFWKLDYQLTNSPQQESATITSSLIPAWPIEYTVLRTNEKSTEETEAQVKRREKSNKRNNGVSNIQITPCGNYIILMLVSGQIWIAKLNPANPPISRFSTEEWIPLIDFGKNVLLTDVHYHYDAEDSFLHLSFLVGFVDCSCLYFKVAFPKNLSKEENQKFHEKAFEQYCSSHFEWKPHDQKAVNVWFRENYTSSLELIEETGRVFITTSLKGICKIWRFYEKKVTLLRVLETERYEIASSVFYKASTSSHPGYYIIGDSRGGINIYLDTDFIGESEAEMRSEKPIYFFNKVHATDPVSKILGSPKGFISIGHDSTINYFEEFSHSSHIYWKVVNNALTMPVHTCDQINIIYSDDTTSNNPIASSSIYLSGFHGSSFLIYDLRRNYQLMRIEGGGWKRPHSSRLLLPNSQSKSNSSQLPTALFTCPAPVGKTETELQIIGSTIHANLESPSEYPIQLGCSSFGKVSYCSVLIEHELSSAASEKEMLSWLVVAGEDCTMKVFSYPDLLLLQETTLSKNSSMKALATTSFKTENQSKGIVVGGGGKLLYYIWLYDFEHYLDNPHQNNLKTMQSSFAPLQKLYVGNITPDASQDHRIMCVDVLFLNYFPQKSIPVASLPQESTTVNDLTYFQADVYECLLLLSDSRGFMTIVNFQYYDYQDDFLPFSSYERNWNKKQFSVVQHLMEISSSPMLSCAFLELPYHTPEHQGKEEDYRFVLVAGGDSRGIVDVLLLPIKQKPEVLDPATSSTINPYFRTSLCDPIWLYEIHAQDMGTNALAMKSLTAIPENEWDILIGTGGDDQMLSVHFLSFSLHSIPNEQGISQFEVTLIQRMNNKYPYAATAALKGVSFLDSFFHEDSYDVGMMSLAWDQRLLRWDLKIRKPSHSSDPERKQFQITRSLYSSLSQIAPYQNQYEYYFNSPSFIQVPKEEMEAVLEKSSKLSEENIQFSFNSGIVVYISEIASLFTIKTQSKEGQGSNWLCTAVGEGFEVIQFNEN